ncbi:hypothetical protein M758_UG235800 [Ceratodon purpureus]|nr:hypothetical protein M758_UG235800 [Ceratodon purpureus]
MKEEQQEVLDVGTHKDKYRRMMDCNRGAGGSGGSGGGVGGGGAVDLSMCYQCGNLIENNVTYCHTCYSMRSESDFRNEQRWRNLESDLVVVEADLQKERVATKRFEETLQSFRQMLLQGIHADVTIETGEFDKTPAHRAVLASRSPVFRAMFEHELQEKTCAHIRVADVPTPAMRALLLYLYTGDHDTKVMKEHSMALLTAAHKYDIPDLKKVCEVAAANAVQPCNVLEILQQARIYDAALVKKACVECIAQNLKQVVYTEEFRNLVYRNDDPEAMLDTIQSIAAHQ